jgi:hypothetical protein
MMAFDFALEANNLGRILDLLLTLLLLEGFGLPIVVGDKSKSTLVIGRFLCTQHLVEFRLPFMTF